MAWWNTSYLFRKELVLTTIASDSSPESSIVEIDLNISFNISKGTIRSDTEDIELVHETADASPSYTVLGRDVTQTTNVVGDVGDVWRIRFETNAAIPDTGKVYMYYGNSDLSNQPSRPAYTYRSRPITTSFDDLSVSYTRPEEHWVDGVSFTPNAVATFAFYGPSVEVVFESGTDKGIADIEAFANAVDIPLGMVWDTYNPFVSETSAVATLADSLALSSLRHEIQITVLGESNPSSLDEVVKILRFEHSGDVTASIGLEELVIEDWVTYTGGGS